MNQRVFAPNPIDLDEFTDEKSHFHFDYSDLMERSCRISFGKPSQCSISSQADQISPQINENKEETSLKSISSKRCLKTLPVRKFDEDKKNRKKKRKNHVLKEIKTYQRTGELLIPKKPFRRLCMEIARKYSETIRFKQVAIDALQEATEAFIVGMIEDSQLCCLHAKRVTLMQKDMELAKKIRK